MSKICTNCGSQKNPKRGVKGHILIELTLWVLGVLFIAFIFPPIIALVYSIWRMTADKVCRDCGAGNMVPINSPKGKSIAYGSESK